MKSCAASSATVGGVRTAIVVLGNGGRRRGSPSITPACLELCARPSASWRADRSWRIARRTRRRHSRWCRFRRRRRRPRRSKGRLASAAAFTLGDACWRGRLVWYFLCPWVTRPSCFRGLVHRPAAAFVLDLVLVGITIGLLDPLDSECSCRCFSPIASGSGPGRGRRSAPSSASSASRASTAPVGPAEALVRSLASIFSIGVLGIGCLWVLRDPEQQAWHDKIAGTFVVKVPRHWPL